MYPSGRNLQIKIFEADAYNNCDELKALLADSLVTVYSIHTAASAYSDSQGDGNWTHHYVTVVYSVA